MQRSTFVRPGLPFVDWRENLVFDGRGRMWVSDYTGNKVEGYDATGRRVATLPVKGPGGLAQGPDGRIQVNTSIVWGEGTVSSFDPAAAQPSLRVDIPKVSGHNGLAVDGQGRRYVTGEGSKTVRRYGADGTFDAAWSSAARASSSNGAFVAGDSVFVSRLIDLTSSVVRLSTAADPAPQTVASLSPYVLNFKGLDDLTVVGRHLYVAGFISGEITRVDTTTGATCQLASGIALPTSVRAPKAFGDTDPSRDLFVTAADGAVTRLTVTPR